VFQDLLHFVSEQSKPKQLPLLKAGYTVKVHQKIKEGNKERIQGFVGLIIKINSGNGVDSTFTVRKIVEGIGVEKTFPIYSPLIAKIEILKKAKVRRAKMYFMRDRSGKSARLKGEWLENGDVENLSKKEDKKEENVEVTKEESKKEDNIKEENAEVTKEESKEEESK